MTSIRVHVSQHVFSSHMQNAQHVNFCAITESRKKKSTDDAATSSSVKRTESMNRCDANGVASNGFVLSDELAAFSTGSRVFWSAAVPAKHLCVAGHAAHDEALLAEYVPSGQMLHVETDAKKVTAALCCQ